MNRNKLPPLAWLGLAMWLTCASARAADTKPKATCAGLPSHAQLVAALRNVMKQGPDVTTGLGNARWGAVVNRDGIVCAVVYSGESRADQWPGSRAIAAEKANTANALSKPDFALSTANLYAPTQPGQSLYGLNDTAPPNPEAAYGGDPSRFGQPNDPMVGKVMGGIVVFGGGLALYDEKGELLGGLGVSGDTSCADHVVAWMLRHALNLDGVPAGVAPNSTDNLILDMQNGTSISGYGHPSCKGGKLSDDAIKQLPTRYPVGHAK